MVKLSRLFILSSIVITVVCGCSAGEVSQSDVQKSAQAQADYAKAHPDPPGAGASH